MRIARPVILLVAAVASGASSYAQDTKAIPSNVTEATVFMQGAELTHTASATLKSGANEISIEGLIPNIDAGSVKVNIGGNVVVSAFEYSIDYLSSARTPPAHLKLLKDSIGIYSALLAGLDVDININSGMQGYLETGITKNVSGSEAGLGIDELRKTMDYYKAKSEEILNGARELQKRRDETNTALVRVRNQYNQEAGLAGRNSGILRLNLSAPAAGTYPLVITYYTPSAGWVPYYDVNVASTDEPVRFAARSRVRQTTGLDWENVRLTLSTSVPSGGKTAPLFSTWFLRERPVRVRGGNIHIRAAQNSVSYPADITVRGVVADESGSPLPGVMVTTPAETAVTNAAGEYTVGALSGGHITFSYIGYHELSEPVRGRTMINVSMEEDRQSLEEVVVVGYGAMRKSRAADSAVAEAPAPAIYDHVTLADNALNVTYNINLPYTIPGNGKEQNIDLATKEAAAEYKYYCAPKLDGATYLVAEIADWEKLELLSAAANVTYDGTYIGETRIDASATQEKLSMTLGTDKRVAVTRELARELNAPRVIGGSTEQTFTYRITVRNSQTRPVFLVLKDQYPVSTDRNVVVTLDTKTTTPWTVNKEDTGVVTWEGALSAGEVRTYMFSYTVKYPKNMILNL